MLNHLAKYHVSTMGLFYIDGDREGQLLDAGKLLKRGQLERGRVQDPDLNVRDEEGGALLLKIEIGWRTSFPRFQSPGQGRGYCQPTLASSLWSFRWILL